MTCWYKHADISAEKTVLHLSSMSKQIFRPVAHHPHWLLYDNPPYEKIWSALLYRIHCSFVPPLLTGVLFNLSSLRIYQLSMNRRARVTNALAELSYTHCYVGLAQNYNRALDRAASLQQLWVKRLAQVHSGRRWWADRLHCPDYARRDSSSERPVTTSLVRPSGDSRLCN